MLNGFDFLRVDAGGKFFEHKRMTKSPNSNQSMCSMEREPDTSPFFLLSSTVREQHPALHELVLNPTEAEENFCIRIAP